MKNYKVPAKLKEYVESILIADYSAYTLSEQPDENNEYNLRYTGDNLRYNGNKMEFKRIIGRAKCLHKSALSNNPDAFYVTPNELHDTIFLEQIKEANPRVSIRIYEDEEEVFED